MKKTFLFLAFIVWVFAAQAQDWIQIGSDIDGEAAGDNSGFSVSLSDNGSIVAIGAWKNDGSGSSAGHVRVYENSSGNWTQIGGDIDGEAAGDNSGVSVSLSADGSIVAIGAQSNDGNGSSAGHVRVYENSSGNWTQIGGDIDGEAAHDYSSSVSLSADGSIVAIGARGNDGNGNFAGHVRIYENILGTWTQIGSDIDGEAEWDYSSSVSLSADGSIVAIGAYRNDGNGTDAGRVRVYENLSGIWTQIGSDIDGEAAYDYSGSSVSLSADGSIVSIGAQSNDGNGSSAGHVRVYENSSGNWTQIGGDIDGEAAYDYSSSVSLNANGSIVAIGAYHNDGNGESSGHVRIYENSSGIWTQIGSDIDGEAAGDNSGFSVSLSDNGSIVAIGAYGNDGNGTDAGHVRVLSNPFVWTGATDSNWNTAENWNQIAIPTASDDVNIPNGSSVIVNSPTAVCKNLTLNAGGALSISTGNTLTVSGNITIYSNSSSNGSLIINGTYSGPDITYQRYITENQWHMIGSPLVGQTISSFLSESSNAIIEDGSGNYSMKHYTESPETWSTNYTAATAGDIALGSAYALKRSSNGVINLIGQPNNATVDISITRDGTGWNLLGNPFTSAIAATEGTANGVNNLISANTALFDPSYASIYVWEEDLSSPNNTNNYRLINHADSDLAQEYLQVGQGFFVKSADGGGDFTISPEMQSHQTAVAFKSTESDWVSLALNAEISNAKASTRVLYRDDMTKGLDIGYDAGLLNSYPEFALYSRLVEDNGIDFGLQCLPTDFEELVIPIGLDAKAGEIVSFSASAINLHENYEIVLEDRASNSFTPLNEGGKYSVLLENNSEGTGRFFVRTSLKSTLGFDDLAAGNTFQVFGLSKENQVLIQGEVLANTSAKIFSITGKLMTDISLKQAIENRIPFNNESGIYIIQIANEKGIFVQKFSWVK